MVICELSLMSISERSFQGHGAKKKKIHRMSPQADVGPQRSNWVCTVWLSSFMSVCSCDRRKAQYSPVCQDPYYKGMTHNAQAQLLGCPQLCHSVGRLPLALDSRWHICTEPSLLDLEMHVLFEWMWLCADGCFLLIMRKGEKMRLMSKQH